MDHQTFENAASVIGILCGNALVTFFVRFSKMGKYYRQMQKRIEHAALTPGESLASPSSSLAGQAPVGKEKNNETFIDFFEDFERRLMEKLHFLEMRTGCEFSHISRSQVHHTNEMVASQMVNTAELTDAIDEHTVSMAEFSQFLKSLNGRLKILKKEGE